MAYAAYLAAQGRFDRALKQARIEEKLDPLSGLAEFTIGYIYIHESTV